MKKIKITENHGIYMLNFLQLCIIPCCVFNGMEHQWLNIACNIIWFCSLEVFKRVARCNISLRTANTILSQAIKEAIEKQEEDELKDDITGRCDTCPHEASDCKKFYIVGGGEVCVK